VGPPSSPRMPRACRSLAATLPGTLTLMMGRPWPRPSGRYGLTRTFAQRCASKAWLRLPGFLGSGLRPRRGRSTSGSWLMPSQGQSGRREAIRAQTGWVLDRCWTLCYTSQGRQGVRLPEMYARWIATTASIEPRHWTEEGQRVARGVPLSFSTPASGACFPRAAGPGVGSCMGNHRRKDHSR